ncbi:MAG: carboxypeptidase regulatory-like domain-containing protein [Planctomycetota bacterium]
MSKRIFAVAMLAAFLAALPHHIGAQEDETPDADKALQAKIEKLIEQLGSGEFEERKAAQEALLDVGEPARETLEKALKNPDPEIASAAATILKQLDMLRFIFVCKDEKGAPLKGKKITVEIAIHKYIGSYTGYEPVRTFTWSGVIGEKGVIAVEPFEGEAVNFLAKVEGYVPIKSEARLFQGGRHHINLKFAGLGGVECLVVDPERNNAHVTGTKVSLDYEFHGKTDEKGLFTIKDVPPGNYRVSAYKGDWKSESKKLVTVKPGKVTKTTLKLETVEPVHSNCAIKCTILLPNGSPLANRNVTIETESTDDLPCSPDSFGGYERDSYHTLVTSDKGALSHWSIPAGRRRVIIKVPGYKAIRLEEHDFKAGETLEIKKPIILEEKMPFEVVVKDSSGNPVSDAKVVVHTTSEAPLIVDGWDLYGPQGYPGGDGPPSPYEDMPFFDTNAKGVASVSGFEGTDTAVIAVKRGYLVGKSRIVKLQKGAKTRLEFTLVKTASVDVTIIDAKTRKAIPEAWAYALDSHNFFDDADFIKIRGLERSRGSNAGIQIKPGRSHVGAYAEGYQRGRVMVNLKEGQKAAVTIALERAETRIGTLTGTIKPGKTTPLSKINYLLIYPLERRYALPRKWYYMEAMVLRVKPDGTFKATGLPEGMWGIIVRGEGECILGRRFAKVSKDKTTEISLQLAPLGAMNITLLGQDGKPVANVDLAVTKRGATDGVFDRNVPGLFYYYFEDRYELPQLTTDSDGRCRLKNLAAGAYVIEQALFPGEPNIIGQAWNAVVEPGKTTEAKLQFAKTTRIEGRIVSPRNEPYNVILIPRKFEGPELLYGVTAELQGVRPGGKFTLYRVPPGKYHLIAALDSFVSFPSFSVPVEVKEGVPLRDVELKLPGDSQKFSGKISLRGPCDHGIDVLLLVGNRVLGVEVRPDGTFEGSATPGKYKAYCMDYHMGIPLVKPGFKPVEIVIEKGKDLTGIRVP